MKNQIQTASEVKNSSHVSALAHETRKDKQELAKHIFWKLAILLLLVLNLGGITAQVRPKAWAKEVPFVLKKGVQGDRSDKLANIGFVWSGFKDEFYVVRVPTDNENDLPYFWDCKMTPLKLPLLCLSIFDENDSGTIKIYAENYAVKEVKKETKKRVTRYKIITELKGKSKPNEIALERVERNDNENFEFWNELLMACISGYMFPQNILSGLGKPVDDKEQIEQIQKLFENVWKYSKVMDDEEKLFYLDNIAIAILKGDIVNSDLALSFIKKTHEIAGLNEDERKSVIEDEVFVALLQQKRDDEKDEKIAIEALRQQEREKRKIDWTAVPELLLFIAETVNEYKATSTNSSGESVTGGSANSGGSNCANLQSQYTSLSQKMSSASGTAGYARGQEKVGAISGGQYGDNSASNAAVKSSANQLVRTCQQEMERLQRQAAQCGCPPLR